MPFTLDYDRLVLLDAESLAEGGIREAYEELLPELRGYLSQPISVEDVLQDYIPLYSVRCGNRRYTIISPALQQVDQQRKAGSGSWGRATVAFFGIINEQLADSEYRFYAIAGGNDLGGIFLTPTCPDSDPGAGFTRGAPGPAGLAVSSHG